jgi:hypothetical protein
MTHELKTWIEYFQVIESGEKSFELRKNDRDFKKGHLLLLREYNKETHEYTGRKLSRKITYVLKGDEAELFGLKQVYCILGLSQV